VADPPIQSNARVRPQREWLAYLWGLAVWLLSEGIQIGNPQNWILARVFFAISSAVVIVVTLWLPKLRSWSGRSRSVVSLLVVAGMISATSAEWIYLAPKPDSSASPATLTGVEALLRKYFRGAAPAPPSASTSVPLPSNPGPKSIEPEVVLVAPQNTPYNFEWVPGVDLMPRVNLAGDQNNPVLELRKLTNDPVVAVTLTWSIEGQSTQHIFLTNPHFAKYKPRIINDGMCSLSNGGPSLRVADRDVEHIAYLDSSPSKIPIPSLIWNGFSLRLIANQPRPPDATETQTGFRHDKATVALVAVEYHSGGQAYLRHFRVTATVSADSDRAWYGGFNVRTVPRQYESPDNLRATLQLSVIELPNKGEQKQDQTYSKQHALKLIFKDSPLFTTQHKDRISSRMESFYGYLSQLGLDAPKEVPPIEVGTTYGGSFTYPGPIYMNTVRIPERAIDDPNAPVIVYAQYSFGAMLDVHNFNRIDRDRRQMAAWIFESYFVGSFSGKRSTSKAGDVAKWVDALWEIRVQYGQKFADAATAFGLKAFNDFGNEGGNQKLDLNTYFRNSFMAGEYTVDNQLSHLNEVNDILKKHGLLTAN
jgi:hypothetical protein